jgi:hypothetical protein
VYTVLDSYDGQRNCPKHVDFYSKNKFEKLVHLFRFIMRTYHVARFPECQAVKFWNLHLQQPNYATALHKVPWTTTMALTTPEDENLVNERVSFAAVE